MSTIPRVAEQTRERVSREFDHLGTDASMAWILDDLSNQNPELLDIAVKWASGIGDEARSLVGFCMFYRLLVLQSGAAERPRVDAAAMRVTQLPRVTPDTRDGIVRQIDELGTEEFTRSALEELQHNNPELLQMAHSFASRQRDYLRIMKGFTLFYACLSAQAAADQTRLH